MHPVCAFPLCTEVTLLTQKQRYDLQKANPKLSHGAASIGMELPRKSQLSGPALLLNWMF